MVYKNKLKYLNITETRDYIKEKAVDSKKVQLADLRSRAQNEIDSKSDLYPYDTAIQIDNDYYFELNFIEKNIKLYNSSMKASYIYSKLKKIDPKKSSNALSATLTNKFGAYMIPLFGSSTLYIDFSTGNLLLEEVKKIYANNPIIKKEIIKKILSTYVGLNKEHTINRIIDDIVDEYSLEVIPTNYKYNILTTNATLYPKKTVQKILECFNEKFRKLINLTNMSYEDYLSLSMDDFENNYKEFTKDDAERIAWNSKYFNEFVEIERHFKNTNVRIFKINNQGIYVNKNDLEELENLVKDYVVATPFFKELGIEFSIETAVNNGINCIKYRQRHYIKKTDIEPYKTLSNYNKNYKEAISLYSRVKLKIDTYPHNREQHYPNVKKLILKFAKNLNRNAKESPSIYRIYTAILDNIKFDLAPDNQSENNKLFCSVLNGFEGNHSMSEFTITFMNFLRNEEDFNLMIASSIKERKEKEPYTSEEFINLLSAMLMITSDNQKITKLYRDWRLSTAFSYVFLHYCLAWRKSDFVNNLPIVNLSLVSNDITDGESFIKWLENGNKLSHKQSKYICESLEEETRRLRKKASKNNVILSCIISDALMCEVATLLCINEANRQIFFNDSNEINRNKARRDICFLRPYTGTGKIYEQLSKKLDIDITKILNGNFDNVRMNKGFMHLVRDKAEELNLFAYAHIQLLRSHKSTNGQLSETTKIYLNKSIDNGSLLVFSTGTMGSVLYILKQLVDNDFNFKTINKQIEDIKNLNITPYQLEKNIQSITNKITVLNNEIKRYFANQGTKENFLKRLLYGQSFSGIEEKTKCLIKIVRDEENVLRISPIDFKKTTPNNKCPLKRRSCIGCDYMIALRYFIYEFESKYNQVLTSLENAKSELDKEVFIEIINTLYVPLLNDLAIVLGDDKVHEIVDLNRFLKLAHNY